MTTSPVRKTDSFVSGFRSDHGNIVSFRLLTSAVLLLLTLVVHAANGDDAARVEERVFFAEFDETEQKYVMIQPQGIDPTEPVTLLIALHGHGSDRWQFIRDERDECRATRDVVAAHGMLLISPDYRAKASWMGPAAEADLLQIIQSTEVRFRVKRIILCGGSMGGTGALTFTALHPKLIDGVVALNGTANLVDYAHFETAIAASYGGTKVEVPNEYYKRSAEFFSRHFTMPLATTTGGKDDVVPPESVLRLVARVSKHNSNVLSIHRQNAGHSTNYDDTTRALEFVIDRIRSDDVLSDGADM